MYTDMWQAANGQRVMRVRGSGGKGYLQTYEEIVSFPSRDLIYSFGGTMKILSVENGTDVPRELMKAGIDSLL